MWIIHRWRRGPAGHSSTGRRSFDWRTVPPASTQPGYPSQVHGTLLSRCGGGVCGGDGGGGEGGKPWYTQVWYMELTGFHNLER